MADQTPAELLRATLRTLHMKQVDLARRTGLSTKHINQIAQGKVGVTNETATLFARATGVPAHRWADAEFVRQQMRSQVPTCSRDQIQQAISHAIVTTTRLGDKSDESAIAENAIHHLLDELAIPVRGDSCG
jgi:plasmid maintenance system antidote protein VapI